jgi:hypothetical protein
MHLSAETALDYLEGRLGKDQEAFWKQHTDDCSKCARDVLQWQQLSTGLKRSHLRSASYQDVQNVLQIYPATEKEESSGFRSLVAAIVFDSLLQPATVGLRGASAPLSRQLVMRAEEFDIHIKIWGDREHRQLLGQLLPRKGMEFGQVARFHLLQNGERLESTTTDEVGEFHFTEVPDGDLSLQIDLPNLTVIGALNVEDETD